jgi:galactose oxidase
MNTTPPTALASGQQTAPAATCTPFLLDPTTLKTTMTPQPTLLDNKTNPNLFCSGHTFQPNGNLLATGGHLSDARGLNQSSIYDPIDGKWKADAAMNAGRWYPTATALPDGTTLVTSGSVFDSKRGEISQ